MAERVAFYGGCCHGEFGHVGEEVDHTVRFGPNAPHDRSEYYRTKNKTLGEDLTIFATRTWIIERKMER